MKRIFIFCLILMFLLGSFSAIAGKKHCQGYRSKLDNIQNQQRQASSNKRSQSLSNKEAKARDTWWRCETGKLKPKLKKKKKKKSKKKYTSKKKYNKTSSKLAFQKPIKPLVPFASNNPVVVRSIYQDEKLQAWLLFYKPANMCARPKSTQQFAACVEDKRSQQAKFEQSY
ncbi:hypothetical protein [Colwellia sp. PAMC 21821]|uniref:hypothetical protein n=1 Tax=Colwellia sp. PAMC 21821 TaxID=1816219 RepID=UPI0009BCA924|nr:hypothetical protein [Colwellia sp. PAMC 21821]ARD43917.1 hypothetical protein A3Q33_06065 [Colwellia sp. PAMC 21821]